MVEECDQAARGAVGHGELRSERKLRRSSIRNETLRAPVKFDANMIEMLVRRGLLNRHAADRLDHHYIGKAITAWVKQLVAKGKQPSSEPHMQITKNDAIISRASVADLLTTMFLECLSRGMTLPFTVCHVGINGSVSVTRLRDLNSPMEELFKISDRIEPPINVMIVDQLGCSLKVTVTRQDEVLHVSASDPDRLH